jgi:hypothetical protein
MQKTSWLLFTCALAGCADSPADSLQGLSSTFPCLATNLGLVGESSCGVQHRLVLAVTNGCTEAALLPDRGPSGTFAIAPGASHEYVVPVQFVTGDESACSVSIPITVGTQTGTISFRFE